jgi:hypothetical protein
LLIAARVLVFAAGVKATVVAARLGLEPTRHGQVKVNSDFCASHPNVLLLVTRMRSVPMDVCEAWRLLPRYRAIADRFGSARK